MHDIRLIREQPEAFDAALKRRGLAPLSAKLLELDGARRAAITRAQDAQTKIKELSRQIGQKKSKGEDASAEMAEVEQAKRVIAEVDNSADDSLNRELATIPNLSAADVPDGADEHGNVELRKV